MGFVFNTAHPIGITRKRGLAVCDCYGSDQLTGVAGFSIQGFRMGIVDNDFGAHRVILIARLPVLRKFPCKEISDILEYGILNYS